MKNIYIVRHCEAKGQEPGAKLTKRGVQQAQMMADFFLEKEIESIISSPFERARSSIAPLANQLEIEIILDTRLEERVLTRENHVNWRNMLFQTYEDLDLCYEGGESSKKAMDRAISVISEILNGKHKNTIVVSHGNLISLILKYFDSCIGFKEWESMTNPDVFHLFYTGDVPNVRRVWKEV